MVEAYLKGNAEDIIHIYVSMAYPTICLEYKFMLERAIYDAIEMSKF